MASFNRDEVSFLVQSRMDDAVPLLEGVDGLKRMLLEDSLRDYFRVCVQLDVVVGSVLDVGTVIVNRQGNEVRNPDIMTQHQFMTEKASMLPKLLKHLGTETGKDKDELMEFLRG